MQGEFRFLYRGEVFSPEKCRRIVSEGDDRIYDLEDGLTLRLEQKFYPEFDAVKWVLWFENRGNENSGILSEIDDCNFLIPLPKSAPRRPGYLPVEGDRILVSMNGMVGGGMYSNSDEISASEYNFFHWNFNEWNSHEFANTGGRSSEGTMPFFEVKAGGQGTFVAIGWTGDWRAKFSAEEEGIRVVTGLKRGRFYLKPGEKVRTSSTLLMNYGKNEDGANKFRRLLRERLSHVACTATDREGLMAFEIWGGLPSEEIKKRMGELKDHGVQFEDLWMDAGWYGQCTKCDEAYTGDWGQHTGDYEVNRRVHPGDLEDVRDAVEDAGMRMMLWFEIERTGPKTKMLKEHPDWFLSERENLQTDWVRYLLNYGNEEAWQYAFDRLSGYIERLHMSCYRQDFNFPPTKYFEQHDQPDREGLTEIYHIMGVYRLFDRLLEKFPGLLIDNCSSGGRRIDIEMLQRSIAFFRSDYQCAFNATAEVLQTHHANISRWLPLAGCTNKNSPADRYSMRSSYSASWGGAFYNAIFQTLSEEEFAAAREVCEEYKAIREYFSKDFYNHGATTLEDSAWAIWQYHDPEENAGVILAFRRKNSPFDRVRIPVKGSSSTRFTVENLDDGNRSVIEGEIELFLPQRRSSCLLRYRGL